MRFSKILYVGLPLVLAGCAEFFGDDNDDQPVPIAVPPAVIQPVPAPGQKAPEGREARRRHRAGKHLSSRGSLSSKPALSSQTGSGSSSSTPSQGTTLPEIPSSALAPSAPTAAALPDPLPDEYIRRAGDILMTLRRNNNGINPTHNEAIKSIESQLRVSNADAERILTELDVGF